MGEKVMYVGMDLDSSGGDTIHAIIEAIEEDNEGVVVEDYFTFKKVKAPNNMLVKRETVEACLGREWNMDDIHLYMSSYFGFIEDWDEDQMIIRWNNPDK
ncbi:MmoB/DmpM family protein [Ferviditalea candida]|uniref:MmoB/DmpM family protein n=1 Tax=Ferviditalea candida TaxID=3108399 RepID=A0ABU5ZCL9_9BACL|nr:MmoB/DmpM family protein [Paenibacillaceae bacterium T2]